MVRAARILDSIKTQDLSPFQAGTTCAGFLFAPKAAIGELFSLFSKINAKKLWVVIYYVYISFIIKTLTDMKVTVNILPFLGALVMGFISYSIMQGTAQEVVHFAGVLNEIFTLVMAMMMTLGLLIMSISKAAK